MTTTDTPTIPTDDQPPAPSMPAQEAGGQHPPTAPTRAPRETRTISLQALALVAVFVAGFALVAAVFAVGLAARALDEHDAMAASGGGAAAASAPTITLTEFALTPETVTVPAGTSELTLRNDGAVEHNVSIDGVTSDTIGGGETTTFDISGLAPGEYEMICAIPGHESAGMTGTITIT